MTVSVEVAVLVAVLTFVCGFFLNLLAMRSMFAGKAEFEEYKRDQVRKLEDFKIVSERTCEARRSSCAAIPEALKEMREDIGRLFELIRNYSNNVATLIGQIKGQQRNLK